MENNKILNGVVNELECVGCDLEKIRTIASEGFELLTTIYDKDCTEQMKAYDMLQKQPTLTTFCEIIMDYTDKVNQAINEQLNIIYEQIKKKDEVTNGEKDND